MSHMQHRVKKVLVKFKFCASVHHSISQMKHQLDATLCRFYFCRVTLHVSGASAHHQEYLKLVQQPLVHVLSLQVSHHISLLGPEQLTNCVTCDVTYLHSAIVFPVNCKCKLTFIRKTVRSVVGRISWN